MVRSNGDAMRDQNGMPIRLEIVSRKSILEAEPALSKRGNWVCLCVVPNIDWPVRPQTLSFAGHQVWIVPLTLEAYPGVAIDRPDDMSLDDAEGLLNRLLSVISWRENAGISVAFRSGGHLPAMMALNIKKGFGIREEFDFLEIACPEDERARLALALMREGRGLNHHAYAFLSFWRVLEVAYDNSTVRAAWMQDVLPTLADHKAKDALADLTAGGITDVARHLFASGRCAIAHATAQPIINPDDPRDARRLMKELPLVEQLAVRAIEERFGIDSPSTEYQKHLYELRGWKQAIDAEVIDLALGNKPIPEGLTIDLPIIHVRIRGCPPYAALESMHPSNVFLLPEGIGLVYSSSDRLVTIRFILNFAGERLLFDWLSDLSRRDDSSVAAAQHSVDVHRFTRDYLLNGELLMWDADTGALLSRRDPFIPVNYSVNLDACNSNIQEANAEVEQRSAKHSSDATSDSARTLPPSAD